MASAEGEKASENMPVPSLSPSSSSSISCRLARLLAWPGLLYHVTALSGAQEERRAPISIWWGGQAAGKAWTSAPRTALFICTVRLPSAHASAKICPKDHEFSCRPVRKFRQLRVKRQLRDVGPALAPATGSTHGTTSQHLQVASPQY